MLLSATALYSQVLAEAGVRFSLFSERPTSLHIQALTQNRPLGPEDYSRLRGVAESAIEQRVGNLSVALERFGRSQAGMALTADGTQQPPPLSSPSGRPFFMTGLEEHSVVMDGRWPEPGGTSGPGGVVMEAAIGSQVVDGTGYGVGSRVFITPFRSAPEERIILDIVGVITPADPRAEFWMGSPSQFSPQTVGDLLVVPFYVKEDNFLGVIGGRFPTAVGDFGFNVFIDPSTITASAVDDVQASLQGLETDLNKVYPRTLLLTRLNRTLDEFERDLTLARVPVYVYVSLVVVVILYFLVLITGILGRSQSDELGLLRSRGASVLQVCGVLLLADSVLALAAIAVGGPVAWLVARFLFLPAFGDPGGSPIGVSFSGELFWMAAVGAGISVAVLAASAAGRARTSVAESLASRSRPPEVSFFHRYYLDLLALLLVGLVWWQFRERDGFVSRSLTERGLDIDPTLIVGPALAMLAAALLLMRVLPLAVRLVVWVCMRAGPGWSSYGLARLARDPVQPASLAVMLMLAAALGVFGASFQSSLARSQVEQTRYRIGGEYVVFGTGVTTGLADRLSQVEGVQGATPVLRDSVSLIEGHTSFPALLIAAGPGEIAQSAWFREDFSATPLPQLASLVEGEDSMPESSRIGPVLPPGTERIGVWLDTSELQERELQSDINVWVRLSYAAGRYRNVALGGFGGPGDMAGGGWRFLEAELSQRTIQDDATLHVASMFFTTSSFASVTAGSLRIDDLTALGSTLPEAGVPLEEFDTAGHWAPLSASVSVPDHLETRPSAARTGPAGLYFSWQAPFSGEQRGIHIPPVPLPIPAIGGASLEVGQSLRIKHGQASIPVAIVGTTDLFPTVTNLQRPFLLLDIDTYLTYVKFLPPSGLHTSPNEVWLSLDKEHDAEQATDEIAGMLPTFTFLSDREKIAQLAATNPLAGGGWNGLTGLSMACVGIAVIAVLLLHSAASVRASRVDTAVVKALGLGRAQLFLVQSAEKWLMGGVALAAGAVLGYWPGQALVRLLDLRTGTAADIPPMIPEVHLAILVLVLAGLAAMVMASALLGAVVADRIRIADALREGA